MRIKLRRQRPTPLPGATNRRDMARWVPTMANRTLSHPTAPRQGQTETPIGDGVPADDLPFSLSITADANERQAHGEPDLEQSPVRTLALSAAQCQALPVHAICQALEAGSAGKAEGWLDSVARACHAGDVTIYEEQVLYGRLRIKVAIETGLPLSVVEYLGPDPLAYALSHWQDKWDRTKSQRAVTIARVYQWQGTGRPKKPAANAGFSPDDIPRVATEVMANEAGVSRKLMQGAKRIVEEDPYLADEVASGHMAVTKSRRRPGPSIRHLQRLREKSAEVGAAKISGRVP